MAVLVLYGAFCFFCLTAFLIWASLAKLRPELGVRCPGTRKAQETCQRRADQSRSGGPEARGPSLAGPAPPGQGQTSGLVPRPENLALPPVTARDGRPSAHCARQIGGGCGGGAGCSARHLSMIGSSVSLRQNRGAPMSLRHAA